MVQSALLRGRDGREGEMNIDPNTLIIWLLVGAIAGWLAVKL